MNNFGRAVEALIDVGEYIDHLEASTAYVAALEAAGILMPDLPPVTKPKPGSPEWNQYMADWDAEPMWETQESHGFSAGHEDGSANVYAFRDGNTITDIDILTPEEAEALGLALLAAAQHAKGHDAS